MAKNILICTRDNKKDIAFPLKIQILSDRLTPDNISPFPPRIIQEKGISIAIFNPSNALHVKNTSVCMGNLLQPQDSWWKPLADIPDGSYALFRSDRSKVELLSDTMGARTIWYIQTEKEFIASTSQRAIVAFLGEYQPNPTVYPWMLSTGTLGPELSWDSRIQLLPGDTRLILDRTSWEITIHREPVQFNAIDIPDNQQESMLKQAIEETFEHLELDLGRWVLPLSGGLDSRAILLLLKDHKNLKCVTWGVGHSLKDPKSDATIAKTIAQHLDLDHEFYEIDLLHEPFDTVFNRFLIAGEGRIDNIAGYMDGFKIWKHFFESGYYGILRGDQAFGNRAVSDSQDVYKSVGLHLLTDFENLNPVSDVILELGQIRPSVLRQKEDESLEGWRDRINAEFETPVILAALNDLKLSYVEIVSPFLTRKIIQQIRQLPDDLRTDKSLFRKILQAVNPDIPFAQVRSVAPTKDCLKIPGVNKHMKEELHTDHAKNMLPEALLRFILQNMKVAHQWRRKTSLPLYRPVKQNVSQVKKKIFKQKGKKQILDINILALRTCLISKMDKLLRADAKSLTHIP
jgi:hypothetical protein